MKKAELFRAHAERFLNDFLESIARGAGLGFVVIASTVIGIQAGHFMVKDACAAGHNLVEVPSYSGETKAKATEPDDEYPKPEFKYQYEPASDEKPILKKKSQNEEIAHGAQYHAGDELVVEPISPEFDTTDEAIDEGRDDSQAKASEVGVSAIPEATPTSAKPRGPGIDIGRRTAEVR